MVLPDHTFVLVTGYMCLAVYVAVQIWLLDSDMFTQWDYVCIGVIGTGVLSGAYVLVPASNSRALECTTAGGDVSLVPPYVVYISTAIVACAFAGVLATFTAAFVLTFGIIGVVDVAGQRGFLNYGHDRIQFAASRATLYATMRAASEATVVHLKVPWRMGLLFVFWIATAESVIMFLTKNQSYTFSARSVTFASYALFKSAIFIALPLAEQALIRVSAERYAKISL